MNLSIVSLKKNYINMSGCRVNLLLKKKHIALYHIKTALCFDVHNTMMMFKFSTQAIEESHKSISKRLIRMFRQTGMNPLEKLKSGVQSCIPEIEDCLLS